MNEKLMVAKDLKEGLTCKMAAIKWKISHRSAQRIFKPYSQDMISGKLTKSRM
jgi:hypothetical protein